VTNHARVAVVCAAALAVWAPQAEAVIPQGNTLLNGDGESGVAVSDETSHICPQGWTCEPTQPNLTLVRYGTTVLPGAAESARIGGGMSFFAGGPDNDVSSASQLVTLGDQPEFAAGTVNATFGGCLGGFQSTVDLARIQLTFFTEENPDVGFTSSTTGPGPAERGNRTALLPVSQTVAVPPGTQSFRFALSFIGETSGYNHGYADNLSVTFGPGSGPNPPAPPCSVPSEGGPGGGGPGGGGPDGGGSGGGKDPLKLLRFSTAVVGRDGKARVRVRCNTTQLSRCTGTVSASLVRASQSVARKRKPTLGRARFTIPSLETQTVTIPLRRSDAKSIRNLSKRALARRRLRVRTTTKVGIVSQTQTSLLRLKRRG
jgi:hypothetical protein